MAFVHLQPISRHRVSYLQAYRAPSTCTGHTRRREDDYVRNVYSRRLSSGETSVGLTSRQFETRILRRQYCKNNALHVPYRGPICKAEDRTARSKNFAPSPGLEGISQEELRSKTLLIAVAGYLALTAGSFGLSQLGLHVDPLGSLDISLNGLLYGILGTGPLLALLFGSLRWPYGPFKEVKDNLWQIMPAFAALNLFDIFLLSASAGIGEEIFFRSTLQAGLANVIGPSPALGVASVLFGLGHFVSPTYVVLTTIAGAYFGLLYNLSHNLAVPIVAHWLYDFIAISYLLSRYKTDIAADPSPPPPSPPSDSASGSGPE